MVVDDEVTSRVARPQDYDRIVAVIDDWAGRPVRASLPRLFWDHSGTTLGPPLGYQSRRRR